MPICIDPLTTREMQALFVVNSVKLHLTASVTFSILTTNPVPWDEALIEHRHLEHTYWTGSLGTKFFQSIDTLERLTDTASVTFSLLTTNPVPWDEALIEHRHLGHTYWTGSLGWDEVLSEH